MFQMVSLPPALQWLRYMALSPSMLTKSFIVASLRSKSVAVTSTVSFSVKRRAVSFTMAKASGSISSSTTSFLSRISFSSLSMRLKISSRFSSSVCSTEAFNSSIFLRSSAVASFILSFNTTVRARSSSLLREDIEGYTSLIFCTQGCISRISRLALLPNILLINSINPIMCCFYFYIFILRRSSFCVRTLPTFYKDTTNEREI